MQRARAGFDRCPVPACCVRWEATGNVDRAGTRHRTLDSGTRCQATVRTGGRPAARDVITGTRAPHSAHTTVSDKVGIANEPVPGHAKSRVAVTITTAAPRYRFPTPDARSATDQDGSAQA